MGFNIKVSILSLRNQEELKQIDYFGERSIRSYEAKGHFDKALRKAANE
jgi:hypothetical protein